MSATLPHLSPTNDYDMSYFDYTFFRHALIGLVIISIVGAMIGTYITTRRMVSITGGITHACFGGLGLGYFLGISPIATAAVFSVASALGIEELSTRYRVREDSAIAVVWSLGMAVGILFVFLTPGYVPELTTFLFGNVLTIGIGDLIAFAVYAVVVGVFMLACRKLIVVCAFDSDFARVAGLPVRTVNTLMTAIVAVGIVLTIRLIGIMLLISILTVPVIVAEIWCRRFTSIILLSALVGLATSVGGLFLATVVDVPCSAMIVLLQIVVYVLSRAAFEITMHRRMQ
jgi:zinc transport system permease protein